MTDENKSDENKTPVVIHQPSFLTIDIKFHTELSWTKESSIKHNLRSCFWLWGPSLYCYENILNNTQLSAVSLLYARKQLKSHLHWLQDFHPGKPYQITPICSASLQPIKPNVSEES